MVTHTFLFSLIIYFLLILYTTYTYTSYTAGRPAGFDLKFQPGDRRRIQLASGTRTSVQHARVNRQDQMLHVCATQHSTQVGIRDGDHDLRRRLALPL